MQYAIFCKCFSLLVTTALCCWMCAGCSPQFRFSDHIESAAAFDVEQPKKMLLKRDPDSYEVSEEHNVSADYVYVTS